MSKNFWRSLYASRMLSYPCTRPIIEQSASLRTKMPSLYSTDDTSKVCLKPYSTSSAKKKLKECDARISDAYSMSEFEGMDVLLYETGLALYSLNCFESAYQKFYEAWEINPKFQQALYYLNELQVYSPDQVWQIVEMRDFNIPKEASWVIYPVGESPEQQ